MKKILFSFLLFLLLFSFACCDRSYLTSLDVLCSNANASVIVDGKQSNTFHFSSDDFNQQPLENYENIDFANKENNNANAKIYTFEIASKVQDTYTLSLTLADANKYVVDFLRVGILVDGELTVYKDYDKYEDLYQREPDDQLMSFFNAKDEIFDDITIDFFAGETKEIAIFVWLEEAELYDRNGERYTGWKDKSYKATPIVLSLEVK